MRSKNVPAGFKPPFKLGPMKLYIFDSEDRMAADFNGPDNGIRARGWGRISYRDNAEKDMDDWELWLAHAIDGEKSRKKILDLMNKAANE